MRKVRGGGWSEERSVCVCVCARGPEEACKTERGYPASPPHHSCYICLCPLTHRRMGSTGHRKEYRTMTHTHKQRKAHCHTNTLAAHQNNDTAINVLFTHRILGRKPETHSVWIPNLSQKMYVWRTVLARWLLGGLTRCWWCTAWVTGLSIWVNQPFKRYPWQ